MSGSASLVRTCAGCGKGNRIPASRRGTRVDALTLNIDFAPTLLEMAGLPVPREMQGASLAPWSEKA